MRERGPFRLSGFHRFAPLHPAGEFGHFREVALINRLDGEACVSDRLLDRPGQMTPAHQHLPGRLDAVLPLLHFIIRRKPVFEKEKRAARLQDAPQFAQDLLFILHGAERIGRDDRIKTFVIERDRLAYTLSYVGVPAFQPGLLPRIFKQFSRGIHAGKAADLFPVVILLIMAATATDLEYATMRAGHDFCPPLSDRGIGAPKFDDAWHNVVVIP